MLTDNVEYSNYSTNCIATGKSGMPEEVRH
jgi:hypothetical protein